MQNGMMSSMPQDGMPQEGMPQAMPEQGMMSQPTQESSPLPSQEENNLPPYNGVIIIDGEKVEVVDGVLEIEGEKFMVADDGSWVITRDLELIGYIENGALMEVDDEQLARLKDNGMIEG